MRIIFVCLLLAAACPLNSYKILFYTNLFAHSHVKFLGAAADILSDAGHNVTVLMPVFNPLLKTSLVTTKNVIMVNPTDEVIEFIKSRTKIMRNVWTIDNNNPFALLSRLGTMSKVFASQCKKVLTDGELIEKLKAENYDLAVTEPFDTCAYALFEAINIRAHVALLSSSRLDHVSKVIGQPAASSYNPGLMSSYGDRMNIWQRFMNVVQYTCGSYFFGSVGDKSSEMAKEINGSWRTWRETVPEASFILTNQIPLLDFPAPTFDKIVPIGGLSVKTDKNSLKLEEKWSKILDVRKRNVFISFGSNARSLDMPLEYKNSFVQVIKSMPNTTFIWKYEDPSDKYTRGIDNVVLADWLPQNELLADPRLNVFVTHGGLGSVTELSMMGTPAVVIPLFGDQARNAEMLKRHGGAEVLTKTDLTKPNVVQKAIEQVLNDPKYRKNAAHLAEMLNNQPTNPKEMFVKYVEFAARFGKLPSLDNYGRHQSFIEYFFLDVIVIAIVIIAGLLYISFKVLKYTFRTIFGLRRHESKSKKE